MSYIDVHRIPFMRKFEIPEDVLVEMEVTSWLSDELRRVAVELRAEILALKDQPVESRSEEVTVSVTAHAYSSIQVPRTWWDAFKFHAITVSGNPFFKLSKIRWSVWVDSDHQTKTETVQLVTKAIPADLYPDRKFVMPRESWGRPFRVWLDPTTEVERT